MGNNFHKTTFLNKHLNKHLLNKERNLLNYLEILNAFWPKISNLPEFKRDENSKAKVEGKRWYLHFRHWHWDILHPSRHFPPSEPSLNRVWTSWFGEIPRPLFWADMRTNGYYIYNNFYAFFRQALSKLINIAVLERRCRTRVWIWRVLLGLTKACNLWYQPLGYEMFT